jgi:DNA primase
MDLLTNSYQAPANLALCQYHVERGTDVETKQACVAFNLIKAAVTMEMLIVQYGITGLVRNGDDLRGVCPVHQGKSKREFSVNLVKNTFCCFASACKVRGNVLDFVAQMEHCTIRDAALKLNAWFKVTEQEAGESDAVTAESPPARATGSAAALVAEVEAHIARTLHHAALAEAKLTALKQLLTAR